MFEPTITHILCDTNIMVNNKPEVLIAIIGATGAGKTTFISKATGRDDLPIGHGIDSCTYITLKHEIAERDN